MKVTTNTAPSFTAKLKNNAPMKNFVKEMDADDAKKFQAALEKLDKTHPKDVLEIRDTGKRIPYSIVNTYELVNKKTGKGFDLNPMGLFEKDGAKKFDIWPNEKVGEFWYLTDVITKVATKGTKENEAIFGNTPDTPMTKEEKAQAKDEKARQAVFSMMA